MTLNGVLYKGPWNPKTIYNTICTEYSEFCPKDTNENNNLSNISNKLSFYYY